MDDHRQERSEYYYENRHRNGAQDTEQTSNTFPSVKALLSRFNTPNSSNTCQQPENRYYDSTVDKPHGDDRQPYNTRRGGNYGERVMPDQRRQFDQREASTVYDRRDRSPNWQQQRSERITSYSDESISVFGRLGIGDRDSSTDSQGTGVSFNSKERCKGYNDSVPDNRGQIQPHTPDMDNTPGHQETAIFHKSGSKDAPDQQCRSYRDDEPRSSRHLKDNDAIYENRQRINYDHDQGKSDNSRNGNDMKYQGSEPFLDSSNYHQSARESNRRPGDDAWERDHRECRSDERHRISRNEYQNEADGQRIISQSTPTARAAAYNDIQPPTRVFDNIIRPESDSRGYSACQLREGSPYEANWNDRSHRQPVQSYGIGDDMDNTAAHIQGNGSCHGEYVNEKDHMVKYSVSDHLNEGNCTFEKRDKRCSSTEDRIRRKMPSQDHDYQHKPLDLSSDSQTKQPVHANSEVVSHVYSRTNENVSTSEKILRTPIGGESETQTPRAKPESGVLSDKTKQSIEGLQESRNLDFELGERQTKHNDGIREPQQRRAIRQITASGDQERNNHADTELDEDNLESISQRASCSSSTIAQDCISDILPTSQKNQNARTRETSHSTINECQVDFDDACCQPCSSKYWAPHMCAKEFATSSDKTGHFTFMGSYMRDLHQNQQLLDVKIVIGDQIFMAHRIALSCHSDYFGDLFSKQCVAKRKYPLEIHIKGVTALAFRVFLEYVYTGQLRAPPQDGALCEMMMAAEKLLIPYMRDKCEEFASDASPEEALLLLKRSQRISRMFQIVYDIVVSNMQDLLCSKTFLQLDLETICDLLSDNQLAVSSEVLVFGLAVRWMEYAKCERYKYGPRLLECVRLSLMNNKELVHCSESSPVFLDYPICMDKLIRANWIATCRSLKVSDPLMLTKAAHRSECGAGGCAAARKIPDSVFFSTRQSTPEKPTAPSTVQVDEMYPCSLTPESKVRGPYNCQRASPSRY